MAVAGGDDGDAGREVEEAVAVDVLDDGPDAADGDDRVGPRQARARPRLVEGDVGSGAGAGDLGDEAGRLEDGLDGLGGQRGDAGLARTRGTS
jgi:hypothetical protein